MRVIADLLVQLRFFSRLPLPSTRREAELGAGGFALTAALASVAGALIGLVPAAMLAGALALRLPPLVAAILAITGLVLVTGALHEDGLADCADGFGAGRNRAHKLEIMRDSRIGTFGACALFLSLLLRVTALAAIAASRPREAVIVTVAIAALSRGICLLPLVLLRPSRVDGAGVRAGRPAPLAVATALSIAFLLMMVGGAATGRLGTAAIAIVLSVVVALALGAFARHQIGGQTGDVAGATQQIAEVAALLVFASSS